MSGVNKDLLFATMDKVLAVASEGTWHQGTWLDYDEQLCGTTACFAGWSLMLEGGVVRLSSYAAGDDIEYLTADGLEMPDGSFIIVDEIPAEARKHLGITWGEATELFYSENSLTRLKALVDHIARGEGERHG